MPENIARTILESRKSIRTLTIGLLMFSMVGLFASAQGQTLVLLQAMPSPTASPLPSIDRESVELEKAKQRLELEKLALEKQKIEIENANNQRNLFSGRGLINLLYENSAVITAILGLILGFISFLRYINEKREERQKHEEERFEDIIKRLGGEHEQERVSAAVSLRTFLQEEYQRFFPQVFALVVSHLRKTETVSENIIGSYDKDKSNALPSPLTQALADAFRRAYPLARDALFGKPSEGRDIDTGQDLNAAGVNLNNTYLANADLRDSWLRQSFFRKAILKATHFQNANLEGSDMSGADLEEADFHGEYTILVGVDFSGANLKFADFDHADLERATFFNTCAEKTNFKNARMKKISISNSTVIEADFTDADLTESEFTDVQFASADGKNNANPDAAQKLTDALFKQVKGLTREQIERCKQKGANFVGSNPQT